MARITHLVKRAVTSALPRGPSRADEDWARAQLTDTEQELWARMSRADRRHAAGVAHKVESLLGEEATRPVRAAALLHDVGKVESGLGTYRRVVATLSGLVVGHDPEVIAAWTRTTGFTRRVGLYLQHARLGADLLALAGSDPLTVAWAREHHLPASEWTVPAPVARALKDADDD
jgi:hypothetical protein